MYGTIEKNATARQLVDAWFEANSTSHKAMCRLVESEELCDYAPESADKFANIMYHEYGPRALSALKIDTDDIYVAIAHKYGF